jgi:DNA-directed RNA polymerase subunit beta'
VVKGKDGKILKLARGGEARYMLPVDAILSVEPTAPRSSRRRLARIPTESAKTRDITGGLPRVAELFEARRPKDCAIIAEIAGTVEFGRDYKNKRRISIEPMDKGEETGRVPDPEGQAHPSAGRRYRSRRASSSSTAIRRRTTSCAIKGIEELAAYLVNEIQEVYRLQGVPINDKHIEVIVRQMLQKVEITDPARPTDLKGEQIDKIEFDEAQRQGQGRGQEDRHGHAGAARHHQGELADPLVHLGGVVPGDHPRPHRSGRQRQGRHARRPQGERHRRPADPGRHRRLDGQDPQR